MHVYIYVHVYTCTCTCETVYVLHVQCTSLFLPDSSCNKFCDPRELDVMDEVEYCIVRKINRLAADEIKKLPRGTITTEQVPCTCAC